MFLHWKNCLKEGIPLKNSPETLKNPIVAKITKRFKNLCNISSMIRISAIVSISIREERRAREARNPKLAESQKSTRCVSRVANASGERSSDMARGRGCVTGDYTPSQVATKSCPARKYLTVPNIGARKRRLLFSFLRPNKSCACIGKRHCFYDYASCS